MTHYNSTASIENKTSMKHIQVIASRYEQDDISVVHHPIYRDQFFYRKILEFRRPRFQPFNQAESAILLRCQRSQSHVPDESTPFVISHPIDHVMIPMKPTDTPFVVTNVTSLVNKINYCIGER